MISDCIARLPEYKQVARYNVPCVARRQSCSFWRLSNDSPPTLNNRNDRWRWFWLDFWQARLRVACQYRRYHHRDPSSVVRAWDWLMLHRYCRVMRGFILSSIMMSRECSEHRDNLRVTVTIEICNNHEFLHLRLPLKIDTSISEKRTDRWACRCPAFSWLNSCLGAHCADANEVMMREWSTTWRKRGYAKSSSSLDNGTLEPLHVWRLATTNYWLLVMELRRDKPS